MIIQELSATFMDNKHHSQIDKRPTLICNRSAKRQLLKRRTMVLDFSPYGANE